MDFEKLASGNVLLKDGATIVRSFPPKVYIIAEEQNANMVQIDSDPGSSREFQTFRFSETEITTPTHTDRDDLIRQLSEDFFLSDTVTIDNTGLATEAKQDDQITLLTSIDGKDFATQTTLAALKSNLDSLTFNGADLQVTLDGETVTITASSLPLPTGAATEATLLTRLSKADFEARINTLGQKTMAASTPVVIASDQSGIPVTVLTQGNTGSSTSVAQSATSVTIAAANSARKQIIIRNDTKKDLYLKYGTGATTDEAILLEKDDTWIEDKYTGIITGIWSAAGGDFARVNEVTLV